MSRTPPVNPDINDIADRAKHWYAKATQVLAATQYRLAELAGTGRLDADESMSLQTNLFYIWEALYAGTLCAVRGEDTDDSTWDKADDTYSDGRQVKTQIRIEPEETSELSWEHNRFMLGDGAVNEHPRGTICYISPINLEDDQVVVDPPQELSSDLEDLRRRLQEAIEVGDEADPTEIDGEGEI
jgi:hypothetical protein